MNKKNFTTIYFIFIVFFVQAQLQNGASPYIQNYSSDDYKAASQNWSVNQGENGLIYIGNGDGLLEFDGNTWRIHQTLRKTFVRSIDIDKNNRIYIGSQAEIGYLQADSKGNYRYFSLINKIPEKHREFADIFSTNIVEKRVIFQSSPKILIYRKDTISVLEPEGFFHTSYAAHNKFFVRDHDFGLKILEKDSLKLINGGEKFAKDRIHGIFSYNKSDIIIITRDIGAYLYDIKKDTITNIDFPVKDELKSSRFFCSTRLKNGNFVFGTLQNGIIVTDKYGNKLENINEKSGLINNQILNLNHDDKDNVWVATGNGISYIVLNSPFRIYNKNHGLKGVAYNAAFFKNKLYIGGSDGIFVKNKLNKFNLIPKTGAQNWFLKTIENHLYAGHASGLLEIKKDKIKALPPNANIWSFIKLRNNKNIIAGTYRHGLILYERNKTGWKFKNKIKGLSESARFFAEDKKGIIWLSVASKGVYKLCLNKELDSITESKLYTTKNGLPDNAQNYLTILDKAIDGSKIIYCTSKGVYKFNYKTDSFEALNEFNEKINQKAIDLFVQGTKNNFYFQQEDENGYRKGYFYKKNKYELITTPFLKFHNTYAETITPINDSIVLFNTSKGVICFNENYKTNYDEKYNAIIRSVYAKDSILYNGAPYGNSERIKDKIEFKYNTLSFVYGSTFFEDHDKTVFSFKLEGFDEEWSDWTKKTEKEYTNLDEGNYYFKIKAKNIYQKESIVAKFAFIISPPWYRKWWAYLIYSALITFVIISIVKLNVRRLQKEKENLEKIVKKRTAEVVEQKEEILTKNVELEQQKEEILAQADYLQEANTEITQQKEILELKNENITASINYASRIQKAIMPSDELINLILPEHFIFNKPRDIVSGDFYWIRIIKKHLIFAVADCTGHGVPGAFMSLLGITYLNEIVNKKEVTQANQILYHLRNYVKKSLGQTGKITETKDGIDMALCVINLENFEMQYAGAYNPVYIFRNEGKNKKFIEIKGDKMPIGIYYKEKETFTNHKVQLKTSDVIYLFSDGYIDQFSEIGNKKFLIKRFKKMLSEIYHLPLSEQKNILEETLKKWQGNHAQIDDILVMGMKI